MFNVSFDRPSGLWNMKIGQIEVITVTFFNENQGDNMFNVNNRSIN